MLIRHHARAYQNQQFGAAPVAVATATETTTFNQVEVRNWGRGTAEVITTYPHPDIRLIWTKAGTVTAVEAQALHRDHLGSVRAVTTFKPLTGQPVFARRVESATYKPFGEMTESLLPTQTTPEQKGWTRERYDADAGLQYLNARALVATFRPAGLSCRSG